MNMQMGKAAVYWRQNQAIIVASTNSQAGPRAVSNSEPDSIWEDINNAFKNNAAPGVALQGVELNVRNTLVFPACRVYFVEHTPPGQGNANVSGIAHTFNVISQLKAAQANSGQSYNAIPNWLHTGVDNTHGCPISPPFPVEGDLKRGRYKIELQNLSNKNLPNADGEDVTVFVLDTLPGRNRIVGASKEAGERNMLLKEMVGRREVGEEVGDLDKASPPAITLNYSFNKFFPDPEESAKTGKDIYGRLVGFPMADHGLAVAGIIRDLVPAATIECIRVLNKYGVGDIHTLLQALEDIHNRIEQRDASLTLPVVINMSLVWLPPLSDMGMLEDSFPGIRDSIETSKGVLGSILTSFDSNAIFVASAGNDSDPRDAQMNPSEVRFPARFPAAFADDTDYKVKTMIPVGAINKDEKAAAYSNYPGESGIATYGGDLPEPVPWLPGALTHQGTNYKKGDIDAIRGIYTAKAYPALSVNDKSTCDNSGKPMGDAPQQGMSMPYPMYCAPDTHAWAYWSGTSFAAPIVSALAARAIQCKRAGGSTNIDASIIVETIRGVAEKQEELWTRAEVYGKMNGMPQMSGPEDRDGKVIWAVQKWEPVGAAIGHDG